MVVLLRRAWRGRRTGTVASDAKLVWTVWAGSHFEAMTLYWNRQEWGTYTTDQAWDYEPYPAEWVAEQQRYLGAV